MQYVAITVRIPAELAGRLRAAAYRRHTSQAKIVRAALDKTLDALAGTPGREGEGEQRCP